MTLIVLMGPQGSGKGTQGDLLEDRGYEHIAMGDMLKDIMRSDHPKAGLVQDYLESGDLLPAELTNDLLDDVLRKTEADVLLDGYPRDHDQADHLLHGHSVDLVVDIEISDEEAVRRLSKRRVCTATHKSYSVDEITEEDRQACRAQGGEIIQREDDTPEAIRHRLDLYHEQTQPLVTYFEDNGVAVEQIDGEQSKQAVHEDVVAAIRGCT